MYRSFIPIRIDKDSSRAIDFYSVSEVRIFRCPNIYVLPPSEKGDLKNDISVRKFGIACGHCCFALIFKVNGIFLRLHFRYSWFSMLVDLVT